MTLEWYEEFMEFIYTKNIDLARHDDIKEVAEKDFEQGLTPKQSADCFYIDNYL